MATVSTSTISGNTGGGVENFGTLILASSTISGNSYGAGGGIENFGMANVADCVIRGNSSESAGGAGGGGIDNRDVGTMIVANSTISGNTAMGHGGGIFNWGTLTVTNSTVSSNTAFQGGGISNGLLISLLTISNSTITGNTAYGPRTAGGIENWVAFDIGVATLQLFSCTVSGNSATNPDQTANELFSGGLSGTARVDIQFRNTIIADNGSGPSLLAVDGGTFTSGGHNLIGDGTGVSGFDPTDLVGTSSNPIDPLLGPLQNNGGPTFTEALLPGSPAINAGDPTNAPEWDQRGPGYPRVVNGMIDIGAYEHQAVATTITCSVTHSLLWPPNHRLVNVGLSVDVQPPDATVQVQVYANDNANASDAADIGLGHSGTAGGTPGTWQRASLSHRGHSNVRGTNRLRRLRRRRAPRPEPRLHCEGASGGGGCGSVLPPVPDGTSRLQLFGARIDERWW
jgi:hypothetical protein